MYKFSKSLVLSLLFAASVAVLSCKKPEETAAQTTEYDKVYLLNIQFLNMPSAGFDIRSAQLLDGQNSILGSLNGAQSYLLLEKAQFPQNLGDYLMPNISTTRLSDSIRINFSGMNELGQTKNYTFKYKPLSHRPSASSNRSEQIDTEVRIEQGWNYRLSLVFSK